MPSNIVIECSHALKDRDMTLSFAESVTAGKLVSEFSLIPNCGSVLRGSIVSYDRSVKEGLLGISPELLDKYTPESAQVTEQMAISLKRLVYADINVAVTGLAAPGGSETKEKPVGTMFVHGFFYEEPFKLRFQYDGEPEEVILKVIDDIAAFILTQLAAGK